MSVNFKIKASEVLEDRKMLLLDAAYEVLKKSGCPLSTTDIIRLILEAGVWTTKGKTPEQTLGARFSWLDYVRRFRKMH